MWLLDTNSVINYLNHRDSPIRARLLALHPNDVVVCDIVKAELLFGAYKSAKPERNLSTLQLLFEQFSSLAFDDISADWFGKIQTELVRAGTPIGPYDMLIAAIALRYDVILVTNNTGEFGRVLGLKVEDWLQ